jgi:hypothetical protein
MSHRQQRVMVQPIVSNGLLFDRTADLLPLRQNVIFKNLQTVRPRGRYYLAFRYVLILDLLEDKGRHLALRQH